MEKFDLLVSLKLVDRNSIIKIREGKAQTMLLIYPHRYICISVRNIYSLIVHRDWKEYQTEESAYDQFQKKIQKRSFVIHKNEVTTLLNITNIVKTIVKFSIVTFIS